MIAIVKVLIVINMQIRKFFVEYTNHDYAICQIVLKLCNLYSM